MSTAHAGNAHEFIDRSGAVSQTIPVCVIWGSGKSNSRDLPCPVRQRAGPWRSGQERGRGPFRRLAMSILAPSGRLLSGRAMPYPYGGEPQEARVDRQAIDDIFGPVLARNENALLADDPAFPGTISHEPLTQLEIVAQARQNSDADGSQPGASAADTTLEPLAVEPMTQRRVLTLATPIIGENLLQTAVGAVDTFMVARLGAAAVAGVGTGLSWSSSSSRSSPPSTSARRCWSPRRSAPASRSVPIAWRGRPSSGD